MKVRTRLRVSVNRVPRRISRPEKGEKTGCWRKLHNEEFHNLYSSPNGVRLVSCSEDGSNCGSKY
jgi:hypothetical protein